MKHSLSTVDRSLRKPFAELVLWLGVCAIVYSQTGLFDREIPEYRFGAIGWPRVICLIIAIGAIGQFISQVINRTSAPKAKNVVGEVISDSWTAIVKRAAIFVFPLVWLYLAPRVGFYLSAPFFVLGMLWLMEVRSPINLIAVTGVIYCILLLIFTRFFFVALPVGRIDFLYDLNVIIINLVRIGM